MIKFMYKARERGAQVDSRIILALDIHCILREGCQSRLFRKTVSLLSPLRDLVAGVKIGLPTILTLGEEGIYRLIHEYDWGYFFIADAKIADVGHIGSAVVEHLADIGFDAAIAHAVIGLEDGLEPIVDMARRKGIGVITVPAMSHPGAEKILNRCFKDNLDVSVRAGVDGVVLPATKPKYIYETRASGYKRLIISPGVGVQGAEPGVAVSNGADFEIIGRSIYMAKDPMSQAKSLLEYLRW